MPPVRPRPCSLGATARFLLLLAGTACVAADVPPDPASRPDGDTDVSDSGLAESERAHDAEDEEVSSVEGLCGAELPDPLEAACGDACVVCEAPRIVSNSALGALRGCHRITGGLSLVEDGLDLSPLADVVQIDGTLTLIVDSEPHGLGRLARVGGLAVVGTEGLRGLDSLAIVDGSLHLEQMDDLSPLARVSRASHLTVNTSSVQDLSDLSCLEQVDGNLTLFGNDEMVELGLDLRAPVGHLHVDGLPRLVDLSSIAVGPAPHSVRVSGNAALTALPDLSLVERVGQDLHLADNPLLRDVDLPLLEEVGRDLRVEDLVSVDTVAMPRLEKVVGRFSLQGNEPLDTLEGWMALREVGKLQVRDNPLLCSSEVESWLVGLDVTEWADVCCLDETC